MAHKAAFQIEKCKVIITMGIVLACGIFLCGILSGCPIERSINDSAGQENIILLDNNCGYSVFISVTGFTDEMYVGRGVGEFNTAKRHEISNKGISVYRWSRKGIPEPVPRFAVKNDFALIVSVVGQPDRLYTAEQLIDNGNYEDNFIKSNIHDELIGYKWTILFCPRNE